MEEQQYFTKTSARPLSGKQKAAILFGELGAGAESVLDYLTPQEKHKLVSAMRKLGAKYDPFDQVQLSNELQVLETVERFGKARGIWRDVASERAAFKKEVMRNEKNAELKGKAEDIAAVLTAWLKKED